MFILVFTCPFAPWLCFSNFEVIGLVAFKCNCDLYPHFFPCKVSSS
ncbi:hypothetical protein GLYMA_05G198450v4 [Glycine max]|nr:hypothetical protein GLYMA_05G198450v4 [Glycine max]KAH1135350.1 hypothetical protein GYH30_013220 [Glycine max]